MCGLGLSLECFNVVFVERTQHTNGSQELRHQILVATADAICVHEGKREPDIQYLIHIVRIFGQVPCIIIFRCVGLQRIAAHLIGNKVKYCTLVNFKASYKYTKAYSRCI